MAAHHAIPPPPRVPTYERDWKASVDERLDDCLDRLGRLENVAECANRTETKVDGIVEEQRDHRRLLMRVLDREAEREPTQERDLGNMRVELAKTSASSGRKWGAAAGGLVTTIAAIVAAAIELLR